MTSTTGMKCLPLHATSPLPCLVSHARRLSCHHPKLFSTQIPYWHLVQLFNPSHHTPGNTTIQQLNHPSTPSIDPIHQIPSILEQPAIINRDFYRLYRYRGHYFQSQAPLCIFKSFCCAPMLCTACVLCPTTSTNSQWRKCTCATKWMLVSNANPVESVTEGYS